EVEAGRLGHEAHPHGLVARPARVPAGATAARGAVAVGRGGVGARARARAAAREEDGGREGGHHGAGTCLRRRRHGRHHRPPAGGDASRPARGCRLGRMDLRIFTEPQQGATYDDQLRLARTAEECGYSAFFRSDHFLAMGREGSPGPTDSWITLGALARETSTIRSEEHTSELQSRENLVCRLLL